MLPIVLRSRALSAAPLLRSAAIARLCSRSLATQASQASQDASNTELKHFAFSEAKEHPLAGVPNLQRPASKSHLLTSPAYTSDEVAAIKETHVEPDSISKKIAMRAVWLLRSAFDRATGYGDNMDEDKWLTRFIFLETVAGVPGMVGGMLRHLHSLRLMRRDHGWIHTLLEEAENERMHLLTFLELKRPGLFMRMMVLVGQGVFFNLFFTSYLISPKTCHRFVGYLEEEAVHTYTRCLADLDAGKLKEWTTMPAPTIAINYWKMSPDATMRDVLLNVRADEANHRDVNHTFSGMRREADNPFHRH